MKKAAQVILAISQVHKITCSQTGFSDLEQDKYMQRIKERIAEIDYIL